MKVITISREFGSGGRELAKRMADELGFAYYDREIVTTLAQRSRLDEDYVEKALENGLLNDIPMTFGHSFYMHSVMPYSVANLMLEQRNIIRELANHGNCIIVGRNADIILDDMDPFKIFVHASMQSRVARCQSRAEEPEHLTDKQMMKKIKGIDRNRAKNHSLMSDVEWGDKQGYHLCVNTTDMEIKRLVPIVSQYAQYWFELNGKV